MPLFTKIFKIRAFNNGRIARYLLYALGEIVLVVAGILIALQINNANEANKMKKLRIDILKTVANDLRLDSLMVNQAIRFYEVRDTISAAIARGEYSRKDFEECTVCPGINISYIPLTLNDKGFNQLKDFNLDAKKNDTMAIKILQFYTQFTPVVYGVGRRVEDNSIDNIKAWVERYDWMADLLMNNITDEFVDYMATSQDFRNRTAYFNTIACRNYLEFIRQYKTNAALLVEEIENELGKN